MPLVAPSANIPIVSAAIDNVLAPRAFQSTCLSPLNSVRRPSPRSLHPGNLPTCVSCHCFLAVLHCYHGLPGRVQGIRVRLSPPYLPSPSHALPTSHPSPGHSPSPPISPLLCFCTSQGHPQRGQEIPSRKIVVLLRRNSTPQKRTGDDGKVRRVPHPLSRDLSLIASLDCDKSMSRLSTFCVRCSAQNSSVTSGSKNMRQVRLVHPMALHLMSLFLGNACRVQGCPR